MGSKATERRGRFSAVEIETIRTQYGLLTTEKIAEQMARSPAAIETRARAIFKGAPGTGRWSRVDIARLRRYIGVASNEQLAVIFRRDSKAIARVLMALYETAATNEQPLVRWELDEFKRLYGTRTNADLSAIFGRKVSLIVKTADEHRLSKDKAYIRAAGGSTKMPRWTDTAITMLRSMYPTHSNQAIAEALHRSVKSVVSKAHNLGFRKDEERLRQMGRDNVAKRYGR